ncbi:hypothetical protein IVB12_28525 [Bradyrhizobium sp. 179]|uniref:hypothetical protein n=1 Tax=Bradyrhizobium sp. 179 TaxID=2782648 RepID=UPI001FFA7B41|nr:hypothetical protein [Bradyrhizobium sp. 179]MCK1545778.1 hypothetical protein [Bradyrhizobium sp. 179]
MKTEIVVAMIAAAASIGAVIFTAITSNQVEELKIEALREKELSGYREPLARAAYDLHSRIHNILKQNLIGAFLLRGDERERAYVINNSAFLIGQYLCWTELTRREIQFIDLGSTEKTRRLTKLQDEISSIFGTDRYQKPFRLFAGEQRAVGEALIEHGAKGPQCIGYGAFLRSLDGVTNPFIDGLRKDVSSLEQNLEAGMARLTHLSNALIDLLDLLDPDYVRFDKDKRTKL